MSQEIVVLAYSGGLDTSCILKWLIDKGYKVVCYMANIGQDEDFEVATKKALKIGAHKVIVDDLREVFVKNYMFPAIQMGLLYEGRYLLGTSLARPCISEGLVKTARTFEAKYISHGATGKGNDQVRFELSVYSLWPKAKIIAPWREREFYERFQGRQDLIAYAKENSIPVPVTPKAPWSMDANIMHISYESGILEDPQAEAPESLYTNTDDPAKVTAEPDYVTVIFKNGIPNVVQLNKIKSVSEPLAIVTFLNELGKKHGIGRIDIVENRFIGLKSRGVYETPAGTILHQAHLDLETFILDKEVLRLKKTYQDRMSDFVYNGFWFSPEAVFAKKCLELSQEDVYGNVTLKLCRGNAMAVARMSPTSTYNKQLVSMDEHGGLCPEDATGFINIHAIRLKEYNLKVGGK